MSHARWDVRLTPLAFALDKKCFVVFVFCLPKKFAAFCSIIDKKKSGNV